MQAATDLSPLILREGGRAGDPGKSISKARYRQGKGRASKEDPASPYTPRQAEESSRPVDHRSQSLHTTEHREHSILCGDSLTI